MNNKPEKETIQTEAKSSNIINIADTNSIHYDGRHYDLMYENFYPIPNLTKLDLSFLSDIANQYGDPILELCCGTGRIAIPLAEKGWQVTGIDVSESMLEAAKRKSSKVKWVKADVRNFEIDEKFSLIIFSANSICHILTMEDLESCFKCVKKHLKPEGRIVIHTFNFYTKASLEDLWNDSPYLYSVYQDPDAKGTVVVTAVARFDLTEQLCYEKMFFKLVEYQKEFVEEVTYRIYHPNELEALLKYNGFTIERKLGNYEQEPFTSSSPNHIIISKLKE
ncbi:MAG: methyltransferase domain-containing protein [Nostoc sp.]|uniref:class I SAM-dependent DNA methyltransferase n=1 Tax=Nostoc sp. TaxID=1180 RepID=UPI002FF94E15